jgi:membrane protein CcdC involved in cytochrome C biogenesis
MNKSKFSYSNRTKIIVIILLGLLTLYIGSLFTDIIDENPLYEGGFWIGILAWITSMYFDGKAK